MRMYVKSAKWTGPIDRIEIVDVNPEEDYSYLKDLLDQAVYQVWRHEDRADVEWSVDIDPDGTPLINVDTGDDQISVTIETRPITRRGKKGWEFIPTVFTREHQSTFPAGPGGDDLSKMYQKWADIVRFAEGIYRSEFFPDDYLDD